MYLVRQAELQEFIQDMHTEYKARIAAARDQAQAQVEMTRQNDAASSKGAANAGAELVANVARALKKERDELGLEMHMCVLTHFRLTTRSARLDCLLSRGIFFLFLPPSVHRRSTHRPFLPDDRQCRAVPPRETSSPHSFVLRCACVARFVSAYLTAHPQTTFAETEQCVSDYFGHISMCVFRDLISRSFLAHELQRELEVEALKQKVRVCVWALCCL